MHMALWPVHQPRFAGGWIDVFNLLVASAGFAKDRSKLVRLRTIVFRARHRSAPPSITRNGPTYKFWSAPPAGQCLRTLEHARSADLR